MRFGVNSGAIRSREGVESVSRRTAVVTRSEAVAGPPPTPPTRRRRFGVAGGLKGCTGAARGSDEVARARLAVYGKGRRRNGYGGVCTKARHARRRGGGPGWDLDAWHASRRRRGHVVPLKVVCVRKTKGRFDAVAVPFAYIGRVLYMRTFGRGDLTIVQSSTANSL